MKVRPLSRQETDGLKHCIAVASSMDSHPALIAAARRAVARWPKDAPGAATSLGVRRQHQDGSLAGLVKELQRAIKTAKGLGRYRCTAVDTERSVISSDEIDFLAREVPGVDFVLDRDRRGEVLIYAEWG